MSFSWFGLLSLIFLEIVLGIDNLVFIAIVTSRLPSHQQPLARKIGLALALISRLLLLWGAVWAAHLMQPWFEVWDYSFSIADVVFIVGGLFLLIKGTYEIQQILEPPEKTGTVTQSAKFIPVVLQVMLFDVIFSLDSVATALGLTRNFSVMAIAIIIAVILMLIASEWLCAFIERYPSLKILALAFLLIIGVVLVAEGFGLTIPHSLIYFALGIILLAKFVFTRWFRQKK